VKREKVRKVLVSNRPVAFGWAGRGVKQAAQRGT